MRRQYAELPLKKSLNMNDPPDSERADFRRAIDRMDSDTKIEFTKSVIKLCRAYSTRMRYISFPYHEMLARKWLEYDEKKCGCGRKCVPYAPGSITTRTQIERVRLSFVLHRVCPWIADFAKNLTNGSQYSYQEAHNIATKAHISAVGYSVYTMSELSWTTIIPLCFNFARDSIRQYNIEKREEKSLTLSSQCLANVLHIDN